MKYILLLLTAGFLAFTTASAQSSYPAPYTFLTIAGTALDNGAVDGSNGVARLYWPEGITVDTNGIVYVVDNYENTIRKAALIGTNWVVTTIAGTAGSSGGNDGMNGSALFSEPADITIDQSGRLFVADGGNDTIRMITQVEQNWVVKTIAGTAEDGGGNDGTNGVARFYYPSGITVDNNSNLYVADAFNDTIRKITPVGTNWVVTTIAGTAGNNGVNDGTNGSAQFSGPSSIAIDVAGNLYVADTYNYTIRKVAPVGTNWVVTTIAGTAGSYGSSDGTNGAAQFSYLYGITVDAGTNLYLADTYNNTIRKVAPVGTNWVATTLAGVADGSGGGSADGTGTNALFATPYGITVDSTGALYVGDTVNGTLRQGRIAAVPNLTAGINALNGVVISWPNLGAYALQTNADLTTANWGVYGGAVTTSNGTNSVTFPTPAGNLFFRLTN
jgi:hypothetical protein